ncbi:MAG TPA: histidine triad nucleotide-binding protein [Longimicrobiales bacterium]
MDQNCLFCKVAAGAIPARIAYEDDDVFAFHDIDPRAPVHVLLIPREHIASVNDLTESQAVIIGGLFLKARDLARELGVSDSGYRLVMNTGGDAGQSVAHIHLHLLGGRPLKWPPG